MFEHLGSQGVGLTLIPPRRHATHSLSVTWYPHHVGTTPTSCTHVPQDGSNAANRRHLCWSSTGGSYLSICASRWPGEEEIED